MCSGLEAIARIVLVILNFIIWLVGTAVIVLLLLVYFLVNWDDYPEVQESSMALGLFIGFMTLGCFLFIFGLSGCCGACCGSCGCMTIYLVFVYIVFGCALGMCIWFGTTFKPFSDDLGAINWVMDEWVGFIQEGNETSIESFESMQTELECCGTSNGTYIPCEMWYYNTDSYSDHLESCKCNLLDNENSTVCQISNSAYCGTEPIWIQGCDQAISSKFGGATIGITSMFIFFTIAALVLVIVSCYTVCRLKKKNSSTSPDYEMTEYEKDVA